MTIATGIFKKLSFKKQTALGAKSPPTPAGSAQYLRRVTSTIDTKRTSFKSKEILPTQQIRDFRLGVRSVTGTITGELSVGTYQQPIESVLRQISQAVVTTGSSVTITAASTGTNTGTFTASGLSFLTLGFKVGDVVLHSGWTAPALANNAHNFLVIALTATVMTVQTLDGGAVTAKAAGDSVTIIQGGKKTWVPSAGQSRDYYTLEHWHSDIAQSEVYNDCVFGGFDVKLPANNMTDISFPVIGLNMVPGVAEYFTTPNQPSAGGVLASVNGLIIINGAAAGIVTSADIKVTGTNAAIGGIVGATVDPDIYFGPVEVTGSTTILFQDNTMRDLFLSETECSLAIVLTANNTPGSPFTAFVMSRVKFSDANKNDGTAGISQTMPFTALEQVANGGAALANLQTTISVQDSAFV